MGKEEGGRCRRSQCVSVLPRSPRHVCEMEGLEKKDKNDPKIHCFKLFP